MKLVLNRTECLAIIAAHLNTVAGTGNWVCETDDYKLPAELAFADATPEYLAEKEAERERTERIRAEWREQEAAKKAAATAIADAGNF